MEVGATVRRGLSQLLGRLSGGLVTDQDADEILDLARSAFGASGALLIDRASFTSWNRDAGVPSAWRERYPRYAAQDPLVARARAATVGTWCLARHELSEEERDTEIFHQFFDVGLSDLALVRFSAPTFDDLHLVLYRSHGQAAFSEDDRALFELVYPSLAGALATRHALMAIDDRAPGGPTPHVWLSYPSRAVKWTEAARNVWRSRLGAIGERGWRRIDQALLRAADRFAVERTARRTQLLRADLRVELAYVRPERGEERRMLALLVPEQRPDPPSLEPQTPSEELLSPSQLAIARAAAGGWSAAEIARVRRTSEETVRSQLKAIYEKLGASRAQLSTLVAPLAPPRR